MKVKMWALALIVAGAMLLGAAGGFALSQGLHVAGALLRNLRVEWREPEREDARLQQKLPELQDRYGSRSGQQDAEEEAAALPPGFNAGVSVPAVYGEMTGRTEEQVLSGAAEAGMDTWGLAEKEGRLDELRERVLSAVTASLDKMVEEGTITEGQKKAYLVKVHLILEMAGATNTDWREIQPGGGPWRDGPEATEDPGKAA